MPDGDLYTAVKHMLMLGALHSAATMMLTEYLKQVFKLGSLGVRLFPILWSVTVTVLTFPHAASAVGLTLPDAHWSVSLTVLVLLGITGAGGSFTVYNLWDMLRGDVLAAVRAKVRKWGDK